MRLLELRKSLNKSLLYFIFPSISKTSVMNVVKCKILFMKDPVCGSGSISSSVINDFVQIDSYVNLNKLLNVCLFLNRFWLQTLFHNVIFYFSSTRECLFFK